MKLKADTYTLSSGRSFYANRGILGLAPEREEFTNRLTISEGYDGGVGMDCGYSKEKFTAEERAEVALWMINLWREWGEQPPELP